MKLLHIFQLFEVTLNGRSVIGFPLIKDDEESIVVTNEEGSISFTFDPDATVTLRDWGQFTVTPKEAEMLTFVAYDRVNWKDVTTKAETAA